MDTFNWMVMELIAKEAQLERLNGNRKDEATAPRPQTSVTRWLASLLVRLGLRLDPAAGEGLSAFDFLLAKSEKATNEIRS